MSGKRTETVLRVKGNSMITIGSEQQESGIKAKNSLELYQILCEEFGIIPTHWNDEDVQKAKIALEVYGNVEDFFLQTGWGNDNPECAVEAYLTENRICRWIDGKYVYFSRLLWETSE